MGEITRGRAMSGSSSRKSSVRSKSRERRNSKPLGARLKGMMKGIRKSKKQMDRSSSKKTEQDSSRNSAPSIQIENSKKFSPTKPSQGVSSKVASSSPNKASKQQQSGTEEGMKTFRSLQLVLLLMDPESRRFELLQLEFDSVKARVADIIAQIPVSVTEAAIRQQTYEYVLDESATMRDQQTRLLDFCDGRQVLVAVPKGTSIKECVRLARPILCDPQVVKMLQMSGFNVTKWDKNTETKEQIKEEVRSRALPEPASEPAKQPPKQVKKEGGKAFAPIIPFIALLVLVLQTYHNIVTTPIQVGIPLAPGTWRSKCGLLAYSPFHECQNAHLEVHDDGTVAVFNDLNELDMLLVGGICTSDDCVHGILLEEDGRVFVGGRLVKTAARFDEESLLSPWPFVEEPKLKANPFNKVNAAASNM